MEWMPIESAPKNGRKIKILTDEGEQVGYFKEWWYPYPIEAFTVNGNVSVKATHWMPIPPAPETTQ